MKHSATSAEQTQQIRKGSTAAFDAFLKEYWRLLVEYMGSFVESVDEAEDLAQEAFLRVWSRRDTLDASRCLRSYLYQTARNLAINRARDLALHRRLEARELSRPLPAATPERVLEVEELRVLVQHALDALPARRREAFILAHLQNLSHIEIAQVMGIAPQTVANQISVALSTLRRNLGPHLPRSDGPVRPPST